MGEFWPTDAGGWMGPIGGAVTLEGAIAGGLLWMLSDPASRKHLADWLTEGSWWERYRNGVREGLARLQQFFGSPWSWRAFDRCLLLAVFYPITFILVGWAFGGSGNLRGVSWEPPEAGTLPQWGVVTIILSCTATICVIFYSSGSSAKWVHSIGVRILPAAGAQKVGVWPERLKRLVTFALRFAVATAATGASLVVFELLKAVNGNSAAAGTGGLAVISGVMGAGGLFIAVNGTAKIQVAAGVSVIAISGVMTVLSFENFEIFEIFEPISFWLVLPVVNAVMDWLSWAVSRELAQHLVADEADGVLGRVFSKSGAVGHILIDGVLAVVFLFGLGLVLPTSVQAMNALLADGDADSIVWAPLLEEAQQAPWTAGLSVTLMLVTTLVPTALHVGTAFLALLVRPMVGHRRVVARLREDQPSRWHLAGIIIWLQLFVFGSVALTGLVGWGLYHCWTVLTGETMGSLLLHTACWSARAVGGPGIPALCFAPGG